jgi:hypothetical protein
MPMHTLAATQQQQQQCNTPQVQHAFGLTCTDSHPGMIAAAAAAAAAVVGPESLVLHVCCCRPLELMFGTGCGSVTC